jgi:outer membrane protein assembly factor BamE (lipoprotein component of BamABCDE complex)
MFKQNAPLRRFVCVSVLLLSMTVAGCAPSVSYRGYAPDAPTLDALKPNSSTKQNVLSALGSPSLTGTFTDNVWYYASQREETSSFGTKVTDRTVVALEFENNGLLKEVRRYGLSDGAVVNLSDRSTPVYGRDLNAVQDFLSNLGRFNQAGARNKGNIPGSSIPGA